MSAEPTRAVFLSYASQDAEAARSICEALRQGGVEVWFDADGGLEHGDEWDAKIRRQIKECVLFIPLISANTQAREEGYFRIEWELAAQRAMGIASGVPFILPVVIDDTREPEALVPDRFRAVQWMRLPGGALPPEVKARLLKLWSHRTGALKHESARSESRPVPGSVPSEPRPEPPRRPPWWAYALAAGLGAIAIVWWWRSPAKPAEKTAPVVAGKAAVATSQAEQLVAQAFATVERLNYTRDDLSAAEDRVRQATELESFSAKVWGARAWISGVWLLRNWDVSAKRRQDTENFARRALALDPNEPDALNALAEVMLKQGAFAQAEALTRQALKRRPGHQWSLSLLSAALGNLGRTEEGIAILHERVERDPSDVLARYDLAMAYVSGGGGGDPRRADAALAQLDAALAVQPLVSFLSVKAQILGSWKGNLPAMRATVAELEKLPILERTEDQPLVTAIWCAMLERDPTRMLAAAALTARPYFAHSVVQGPRAWYLAHAHRLAGQGGPARVAWQSAETAVRDRIRENPNSARVQMELAVVLAWLGQPEELARVPDPAPNTPDRRLKAYAYAGLGDAARAAPYIREMLNKTVFVTDHTLALDPWWDKIRGQPEFEAIVAEGKAPSGTAVAPPVTPAPALSPARELAAKAHALLLGLEATREDFALAEEYCQRALKLDSTDAEVCATYAQLNSAFVYRGWEATPERKEQCRVWAERAIRLAPKSVQARLAQAGAWSTFGINRSETEKLLRELLAEQPNDRAIIRFLASMVLSRGGLEECLALGERAAALPGGDPLALYNNARILWQRGQQARAHDSLLRCLAQKPFSSALVLKAIMETHWRGDLAAAEAAMKEIPASSLLEDRANFTVGLVHYYQRRTDAALKAWGAFPREFYNDFHYDGPKGLLLGLAYELDRRDAAARTEWRTALQAVEKRLVTAANQPALHFQRAYLLACLGEKPAAEEALRTHEELAGIKLTPGSHLPSDLAIVYLRLGRWDEVLAHPPTSATRLRLDPRFDAARKDARFQKLLELVPPPSAKAAP
jgi:tetratricopeptide (TPR) repeat protein